jgi:hypothetical protein
MVATSRRSEISRISVWRFERAMPVVEVDAFAFARPRYSMRRSRDRLNADFARASWTAADSWKRECLLWYFQRRSAWAMSSEDLRCR